MNKPVVSVISTTYNFAPYVGQAIESVLAQTFREWELIVIDDASTDGTAGILDRYARKDGRIRVIRHSKNWGIGRCNETHNQALALARGKYVAILDGDDFWPENKLEIQVRGFRDSAVVFSYGDCVFTNGSSEPFHIVQYRQEKRLITNDPPGSILELFADLNFYIVPVTAMIRKSALHRIGGFRKDRTFFFIDVPTFLPLALEGKFHYAGAVAGFYRKHGRSHWFNMSKKTSSMGRRELQQCYLDFVKKNAAAIRARGVSLDLSHIKTQQDNYISFKNENKLVTVLMHYLIFNDTKKLKTESLKAMRGGSNLRVRLAAAALMAVIPFRGIFLRLLFNMELLRYLASGGRRHVASGVTARQAYPRG